VAKWHRHGHLHTVRDRMLRLLDHNPRASVSTITSHSHAAIYPETVHLTALLVTPGWLTAATSGRRGWMLATDHIATHITAGYHPTGVTLDAFERLQLRIDRTSDGRIRQT
jgi:hypothetical protein